MTQPRTHILLAEDDRRLGASIVYELQERGYRVTWVQEGPDVLRVDLHDVDLLVLDLMLPGKHGFDVLKELRTHSDLPVIILTARTDTADKVRGLTLGGDDYLTKPFWPEELVARIVARLRRPTLQRTADMRELGQLRLDLEGRRVWLADLLIELTRVEFDILAELTRRPGMAITRAQLVDRALDEEREGGE